MKIKKEILFLILGLFLVSCGPVTPAAIPSVTALPSEEELIAPVPMAWPEESEETWISFNSDSKFINKTAYDPSGFLWLIKAQSVYRWNIESNQLVEYTVDDGLPKDLINITVFNGKVRVMSYIGEIAYYSEEKWISESIPSGYGQRYAFADTGDRLWTLGNSIYYLEGESWKEFDSFPKEFQGSYTDVAKSKDGSLWFVTYTSVLRFDGDEWYEYKNLQGVNDLAVLSDGTLLFIFYDQIISFDGDTFTPLVLPGDYHRYSIEAFFLTADQDLWFQLSENLDSIALPTYLVHNGEVRKIPDITFDNFPNEDIYRRPAAFIPEGWLFFSNNFSTMYLFDGKEWKELEKNNDPLELPIVGFTILGFSADGALWVVQDGSPAFFDGKRVTTIFAKPNYDDPATNCLYMSNFRQDSKNSWWGWNDSSSIICYFNVETGEITRHELYFMISNLAVGSNGQIWVASKAGFVAQLTPEFLKTNDYQKIDMIKVGGDSVHFNLSPSRVEIGKDGTLWVFVPDSGLYGYHDNEWKYYGLAGMKDASAFTIDLNGHVWAGFCGKLLENDGEKWITHAQGCMAPTKLVTAPDNSIWFINGGDGVYHFDGVDLTHFDNEQFGGYVPEKILFAPDGAIWFSNYQGLQRYKP